MKRPTITDLAAHAGVSASTVKRLIHGREHVRPETVERILVAAEDIGYYGINTLKARKRDNLPHRKLGFLLQQSHRLIYQQWADALKVAADRYPHAVIQATVEFEDNLAPEAIAQQLLELGKKVDAIAIVTPDHPLISNAIDELKHQGVPVVAYISDLSAPSRAGFVGTDNWKAGRTAAWFLTQLAEKGACVVPLIGSHRYQCQDISDSSFRSYIREMAPDVTVLETLLTKEEPDEAYKVVKHALQEHTDLKGIFVNGGGISGVLNAIRELPTEQQKDIKIVCRDMGEEARVGLQQGLIAAGLHHPAEFMSNELIQLMLDVIERKEDSSMQQRIVAFSIATPESI
ncbi:LacI family DNA-binding transcriptional regulator [Marinomonas rhizomae]|uniref:Monosaccharide ABC transporter substrate-binding protein (CUT2 family) n=1 Tax=Marinomonas rhizomae TaxID=491948 RepID=A0A366J9Y0_9GAMM|nr:monosaccharide ABC transporter substrate-binding protein (CUT2 family) [Marinomonas rhizomae]RNF73470.1 LacI family DNA-binding transcriptional regulator [Marinomonas rhizomae]